MTKFKSKSHKSSKWILAGFSLLFILLIGGSFLFIDFSVNYIIGFNSVVVILWLLMTWVFIDTRYSIKKGRYLIVRSGPFIKKLKISSITKILVGKTPSSGFFYATGRRGLIIYYEKAHKIYISPESNETFLDNIRTIKPNLNVELYERYVLK